MDDVLDWLMAGDPAIRWQTERDLLDRSEDTWAKTREMVAIEGWGKQLLELQDTDGTWAGDLYQPKWTGTTYTMLLLRRLGLPPNNASAQLACEVLLDRADWVEGGISYFESWTKRGWAERCVNGMLLSLFGYFGIHDERVDSVAELLIGTAFDDGGWNCQDHTGATHSSFHTTISVLEGLWLWKQMTGSSAADGVLANAHEFLLRHEMFKSHRTGEVFDQKMTKAWFPPRWHYDLLRGLDHFQSAGVVRDERAADAVDLVRKAQRPDGRWPKGSQYTGLTWFTLEPGRVPGRMNTLRSLRVLRWWDA